MIGGDTIDKRV